MPHEKKEYCSGIIPLRKVLNHWEVMIVQHRKGYYWGFPKGHVEGDGNFLVTAKRELEEETGSRVLQLLPHDPLYEEYCFQRDDTCVRKAVTYYLAMVTDFQTLQKNEIVQIKWIKSSSMPSYFTFPEARILAKELMKILKNL